MNEPAYVRDVLPPALPPVRRRSASVRCAGLAASFAFLALPATAVTLYFTEFEEFSAGPDQWAGTNGWQGNSLGVAAHGIDQDIVPALGKTAYLGYNRPGSPFVTVYRPVLHDPSVHGVPVVEFETLMGIQDSTNGRKDSFFFSFYNSGGSFLGGIRFDNSDSTYGLWRLNGIQEFDTGIDFIRSELHLLYVMIDLSNNTWYAELDGIPLFESASFNATGQARDLGFVAAEWQLSAGSTNLYGNNWMLVADWAVRAIPDEDAPFSLEQMVPDENGDPVITWTGAFGFDYEVEIATSNFLAWSGGLPGGDFPGILAATTLVYTASDNGGPAPVYRIRRAPSP